MVTRSTQSHIASKSAGGFRRFVELNGRQWSSASVCHVAQLEVGISNIDEDDHCRIEVSHGLMC
jgi:hypothetical protein